jgi:hypothetical protein
MLWKKPYKFKKLYGGTPEPQTTHDAPWLHGPFLKKIGVFLITYHPAGRQCGTHWRSGFFYTLILSRNHGIQFYGFRVRVVQDFWFAVHARIACMAHGQSTWFAWNSACDPHAK